MDIAVISKHNAEKFITDERHLMISITSTVETPARLPEQASRIALLRLVFDDIDVLRGEVMNSGETICTEQHANAVAALLLAHRQQVPLLCVVHCGAGLSRSPAVAAAITRGFLRQDDAMWFERYMPNRFVYRMMLNAFEVWRP